MIKRRQPKLKKGGPVLLREGQSILIDGDNRTISMQHQHYVGDVKDKRDKESLIQIIKVQFNS
jgi:hypothetical protein